VTWRVIEGDCGAVLATLPAESVQTCVTSPPYWGLRDYGHSEQLGLEATPEKYVARMVEVFREVRRVLKPDGTLWLNLGDCYATGAGKVGACPGGGQQGARWAGSSPHRGERSRQLRDGRHAGKHTGISALGPMTQPNRLPLPGLKPKDLVGIPWRVAFALQADGWWLRSDIVWSKPNPMPESVRDRPTRSHEYVFLLSKSARYFYDAGAVREEAVEEAAGNTARKFRGDHGGSTGNRSHQGFGVPWAGTTRNVRSVWTITTKPFHGVHFAVMPWDLAERCVLTGSKAGSIVMDPFAGAGTVGMVARRHGREFVGIEINRTYAALARERIAADMPLLNATPEVA